MSAVLVTALIVVATIAIAFTAHDEDRSSPPNRLALIRTIAYSLFTVLITFELAAGALWDLLQIEYVRVMLTHLGYPLYLLIILGVWRGPGAVALLAPRFPRLKEWAYAGAYFDYTGAAASHLLKGDHAALWVPPLAFATLTMLSWALRPSSRRLMEITPAAKMRAASWLVPILIVAAMLVVGFFTLPQGGPPQ
jgi:hypothetical protein